TPRRAVRAPGADESDRCGRRCRDRRRCARSRQLQRVRRRDAGPGRAGLSVGGVAAAPVAVQPLSAVLSWSGCCDHVEVSMKKTHVKKVRTRVAITRKGKAVAKPGKVDAPAHDVFGCMAGIVEFVGDVESPVLPALKKWNASRSKFF